MSKRFFKFDDEEVYFVVVATDLEHAKQVLRDTGQEFGLESRPLDEATEFKWSEMSLAAAGKMKCCREDDLQTVFCLSEANPGEWFTDTW